MALARDSSRCTERRDDCLAESLFECHSTGRFLHCGGCPQTARARRFTNNFTARLCSRHSYKYELPAASVSTHMTRSSDGQATSYPGHECSTFAVYRVYGWRLFSLLTHCVRSCSRRLLANKHLGYLETQLPQASMRPT